MNSIIYVHFRFEFERQSHQYAWAKGTQMQQKVHFDAKQRQPIVSPAPSGRT